MTGRLPRGVMWDVKTAHYLKKRPNSPFAFFLAGWAALQWGDPDRALECFEGAIAVDSGYTPAYMGFVCREVYLGRLGRASAALTKYASKLGLSKAINRFRLAGAISACALPLIRNAAGGSGGGSGGGSVNAGSGAGKAIGSVSVAAGLGEIPRKRGFIASIRFFASDRFKKKPWVDNTSGYSPELLQFHKLIRYIELLLRDPPIMPSVFESGKWGGGGDVQSEQDGYETSLRGGIETSQRGGGASLWPERRTLSEEISMMPGLLDEFRFYAASDRQRGLEGLVFTFDNPAIFKKTLLNKLFREKIFIGELREPRIILSNLRRDSSGKSIDNTNKWLFLKLCYAAQRGGNIAAETAHELESDGWWADPLVRIFLSS